MDLKTFEEFVRSHWMTPQEVTLPVAALGLCGEAGEVADIIKKLMGHPWDSSEKARQRLADLKLELGDVFFYWVKLAHLYGFTPEEIMQANIDKLSKRDYVRKT